MGFDIKPSKISGYHEKARMLIWGYNGLYGYIHQHDVGLSENSTYPYPTSIVFITIQFHTYPISIAFCHIPWDET